MGICERCGRDFQAYCAKCRDEIRQREAPAVPSDDLMILLAFDNKTKLYRYGCNVKSCPCNLGNGWCSKATPEIVKDLIVNMLHGYDGDNAVRQFCG